MKQRPGTISVGNLKPGLMTIRRYGSGDLTALFERCDCKFFFLCMSWLVNYKPTLTCFFPYFHEIFAQ